MSWQIGVLSDQYVNIAPLGRVTSCMEAEKDNPLRLSDLKYPLNNIVQ